MACVTLKRPLDFDPLEVLHSPNRPPTKRRRCTPIKNVDRSRSRKSSKGRKAQSKTENTEEDERSVFIETPLTTQEIATNLKDELKRLKHRKGLMYQYGNSSESAILQPDSGSDSFSKSTVSTHKESLPISSISAISSQFSSTSISTARTIDSAFEKQLDENSEEEVIPKNNLANPFAKDKIKYDDKSDKKVFSLKEMTMICEKMCKERTDAVRQEYDKILHQKLSEQYDAFVKFIDHQIQQRFNESQLPSYLS